ncbi:MAG: FAD:protein FMN transferase, partial [Myxococcales bacterium]|nr:FAD:protein FMN transferase [Myxococcales bacterium]
MSAGGPSPSPHFALLLVAGGLLWACRTPPPPPPPKEPAPRLIQRQRELMHTMVTIAIAEPSSAERAEVAFERAFAVFREVEETMNEWRPKSALGRINAGAGGEPVPAPASLCAVIRLSLDGAKRTGGLFDPSWAALRELWRFGDGDSKVVPDEEALASKCRLVDWRKVEVSPSSDAGQGCTVRLPLAGMQLGLGGVVKGWGVDRAVEA